MVTECIFCEIMAGRAPGDIVHQDDLAVAFIDPRQHNPGHVLVVPRTHIILLVRRPSRRCLICTCMCIHAGSATDCCACTLVRSLMRIRLFVRRTRSACEMHSLSRNYWLDRFGFGNLTPGSCNGNAGARPSFRNASRGESEQLERPHKGEQHCGERRHRKCRPVRERSRIAKRAVRAGPAAEQDAKRRGAPDSPVPGEGRDARTARPDEGQPWRGRWLTSV